MNRRLFLQRASGLTVAPSALATPSAPAREGAQRLTVAQLQQWQALRYGMFIHFGMSTFVGQELPDGTAPASLYNPDRLDVDSWVQLARDAGMRYAVLTTKHVAGHCLWPSRHTDYTVAQSGNRTDVVDAFVKACQRHGLKAGFYYCSWDNHHRMGSQTPSVAKWAKRWTFPRENDGQDMPFTTSTYQSFQTAQLTELLTQYGPIAEVWIDIPGVLGEGYRTFLYQHVTTLQSETVVMMNTGIGDGVAYERTKLDYAWPSDLIAIERDRPPAAGHQPWRTINEKRYYLPAEHCDPIGKEWFFVNDDLPRPDAALAEQLQQCLTRNANFLLNVPPDRHGQISKPYRDALLRLRKNVGL